MDIIMIDSGKGGTGKSTVAAIVCAALERIGKPFIVLDTDDSNPDVARAYADRIQNKLPDSLCLKAAAYAIDGDHAMTAWASMLTDVETLAQEHPDGFAVLVNGARMARPYQKWGATLGRYRIATLWVADQSYAALENLDAHVRAVPNAAVTVVLNGGTRDAMPEDFHEWNNSVLKNEKKLPSVHLPTFGIPDVLHRFSNDGLPLSMLADDADLTVGQKIMFSLWLDDAVKRIAGALDRAGKASS